jgi:hypothetical protein
LTRAEAAGIWPDDDCGCWKGHVGWLTEELARARALRRFRIEKKLLNMIVSPIGITTEILYDSKSLRA